MGGWEQRLFTAHPFMLFTFYASECITYFLKKAKRERKTNLKETFLDT